MMHLTAQPRGGRNEHGSDSGQTLVEFAISSLLFLLLLFSVIEFSYIFFVKMTLQNAVRQAGRYAITGQTMAGQASRYNSIVKTAVDYSMGLVSSSDISIICVGGCSSAGGPGDTITISVTYKYKFLTGIVAPFFKNGLTFNVSDTFKNEPFPPGT